MRRELPSSSEPSKNPAQPSRMSRVIDSVENVLGHPYALPTVFLIGAGIYGYAMLYILSGRYAESVQRVAKATATISAPVDAILAKPTLVPVSSFVSNSI